MNTGQQIVDNKTNFNIEEGTTRTTEDIDSIKHSITIEQINDFEEDEYTLLYQFYRLR